MRKRVPFSVWIRRNRIFVVIVFIAIISTGALAFLFKDISESRAFDSYMSEARDRILTGEYDRALSSLRKAAAIDATDDCLLLMAQCYEAQGNYDKAILALRSMTSVSSGISTKIAAIQNAQYQAENGDLVTVAGEDVSKNSTSMALDNRGLGNEVVQELSQVYALSSLSVSGNRISDISGLTELGGLTSLNLSDNRISDITPLSALSGLRTLYLDNNPITDLTPLYYLQSLTALSLKGLEISKDELASLSAALPNCAINGISTKEKSSLIALGGITFDENVTELDLSYKGLTDISALSRCSKLKTLNISGNSISDISPLMDIPNLGILNISNNGISDLRPLMGLNTLKYLYASTNNISSTVSLGNNTALYELDLTNNPVSDFSGLRKLKNLMKLNLSGTGLQPTDVSYFSYLVRLQSLNIENNPAMTGEAVTELKRLIPSCYIRHSDLVYSVPSGSGTVDSNTASIDLTGQGITDLSFLTRLSALQSVRLAANNITNIYYFQYTESWRTMTYLDLSANYISDITPLSCLINLSTLNLSDNLISDVTPLFGMSNLRELYLGGNPLTELQIADLNMYLPNCNIVFR